MPVNTTEQPTGTHTRYVLCFEDAPSLVDVHEMITHHDDAGILAISIVARDGSCEPILVDEEEGTWVIYQRSDAGQVLEEVTYGEDDNIIEHRVWVEGFTTDRVPMFSATA